MFEQLPCKFVALSKRIVPIPVDPYAALSPEQAVIFHGRYREGKTMRLRTAIPWWRRWGPFAMQGLFIDCANAPWITPFDEWFKARMHGDYSSLILRRGSRRGPQ